MADWKNLPPLFPRSALHPAALAAADARPDTESWCVAFSGGADSLALLLLVWTHWPARRGQLTALHFNHRLRGAESDADEDFCRDVCGALGISFRSAPWSDAPVEPSEALARDARNAFFAREMESLGARVLWTGHHKDDVAETMLMRVARGSGTSGLAAPRPVQGGACDRVRLRPLLTLGKAELLGALTAAGASWREDCTNAGRDYFRNRLRIDVLPAWKASAANDVVEGAALTRELCEEDDAAIEAWLAEIGIAYERDLVDLRKLLGRPQALWRRALRRWPATAGLSRTGFSDLLRVAIHGTGRISVAEGWLEADDGIVRFRCAGDMAATSWVSGTLAVGESMQLPGGARLNSRRLKFDDAERARVLAGQVNCVFEAVLDVDPQRLEVRPWRSGDRYTPLGAPGSAKIQDMFVNRKIPVELRTLLPVICLTTGEILWVPGLPPADLSKVTPDSVTGLQLTYLGGTTTVAL